MSESFLGLFFLEKQFRLGPKQSRLQETSPAETSPSETQFPWGDFWTGPRNSQGRCGDAEEAERMEEDQTVTWLQGFKVKTQ